VKPVVWLWRWLAFTAGLLVVGPAWAGDEVPFITTPDNVTLEMLNAAGVRSSDHVIDLGSGDGRIVITAALRFGASGLGVEIDPALVERSAFAARQAGVAERVSFRVQDLFDTDLSRATVITMYLLPEFNMRLRPRLLELAPGTRIVSHDWDMGDWQPDRSRTVDAPDKTIGREKKSTVLAWVVPARVAGTWCAGRTRLSAFKGCRRCSSAVTRPTWSSMPASTPVMASR
jgi:SAM-dependent methyltransferase